MPVESSQIFLASSFEEHRQLRGVLRQAIDAHPVLPMRAVDLDDGRARHRPPLRQSLDLVRRSDVTVVLVGRAYGGCPPEARESYTHLEYREASSAGDSAVLVYLVGYAGADEAVAASDPRLAAWCQEILENHTPAFFDTDSEVEEIAESILLDIQSALFLTLSESQRRNLDAFEVGEGETDGPTRQELTNLSARFEIDRDPETRPATRVSPEDAVLRPARTAAVEQQTEAFRALDLGERSIAALHLRRALDLMPLDPDVNYWLARILLATGRRQDCREALAHALRSSRLAKAAGDGFAAALALLTASRAASRLGDHDSAVAHASHATEEAGWYAGCHVELAARQAEQDDLNAAASSIEAAFFRHPPSALRALHREASLRRHRPWARRLRETLRARVENATRAVLAEEEKTAALTSGTTVPLDELSGSAILPLLATARESALRQIDILQDLARGARQAAGESRSKIEGREHDLIALEEDHQRQREQHSSRRPKIRLEGAIGGFVLGLLSAALTQQVLAIPLVLALGVGLDVLVAAWRRRRFTADGQHLAERQASEAERAKDVLARARDEIRQLADDVDRLRVRLEALEASAAAWAILSPTSGLGSAAPGDLVRLNPARLPDDYRFELDPLPLPPDLRDLGLVEATPATGQRLFRVLQRKGSHLVAARWACIFTPPL